MEQSPPVKDVHSFDRHIASLSLAANTPGADEAARRHLLTALGCVYRPPTLRTQHTSAEGAGVASTAEFLALRANGLASACDAYAKAITWEREQADGLLLLMPDLLKRNNWLYCLRAPHSPHALACNLLRTAHQGGVPIGTRVAMLKVLNDWVALSGTPPAQRFAYSDEDAAGDFNQRVVRALFGDYWWAFNEPTGAKSFDYALIMEGRPDFLPGLLPGEIESGIALPDGLTHS